MPRRVGKKESPPLFASVIRSAREATRRSLETKVLRELSTPILFLQGTRDPLCPLDLLERVRGEMRAANELYIVEGGDHSLSVAKSRLKASGETQAEVDQRILRAISEFGSSFW